MLKGQNTFLGVSHEEEIDITNISEAYANTFGIKLKRLYKSIEFKTEHPNDSLALNNDPYSDTLLPFYVSYQDPYRVCYTRKEDNKDNIIRNEDTLSLSDKFNM